MQKVEALKTIKANLRSAKHTKRITMKKNPLKNKIEDTHAN